MVESAPRALNSLTSEERQQVYKMLKLRVEVRPDSSLEISGRFWGKSRVFVLLKYHVDDPEPELLQREPEAENNVLRPGTPRACRPASECAGPPLTSAGLNLWSSRNPPRTIPNSPLSTEASLPLFTVNTARGEPGKVGPQRPRPTLSAGIRFHQLHAVCPVDHRAPARRKNRSPVAPPRLFYESAPVSVGKRQGITLKGFSCRKRCDETQADKERSGPLYRTWGPGGSRGGACAEAVEGALSLGYRHIDTAQMYRNEGRGRARHKATPAWIGKKIFLVTKLSTKQLHPRQSPKFRPRKPRKARYGLRGPLADALAEPQRTPGRKPSGRWSSFRRKVA